MFGERKHTPFGVWTSPLSAHDVAQASARLSGLVVSTNSVFWGEHRPNEGGRTAIIEYRDGERIERLSPPWNARSRVHEYGGGAFLGHGRTLFFSEFTDGRIYGQAPGQEPIALTPEVSGPRVGYADFIIDSEHGRLLAIQEAHQLAGEPTASIVSVSLEPLSGGPIAVHSLIDGEDFYASITLSPDGRRLAWLTWSHPNMPWDGTQLWVAEAQADATFSSPLLVAGSTSESIFQPGFDSEGGLVFATDRTDWWNLVKVSPEALDAGSFTLQALAPMNAEFGLPQWVFGMSTWVEASPGRIVSSFTQSGQWFLGEVVDGAVQQIETPYSTISAVQGDGCGRVYLIGGGPDRAAELLMIGIDDPSSAQTLNAVAPLPMAIEDISHGEPVSFPSASDRTAHGFFYAPTNAQAIGPDGERPPLIVKSHGGPTGACNDEFDPSIQFWTSRGFAVVDVNYGGSTGYGRAYRDALKGMWGIVDVEDCVAAAEFLTASGRVDGDRRAIRGGSAGGYTTLAALAFSDTFQAGASHFGVADLEALARDTHKFESRYLDQLVGPYPSRRDLYVERAPLHSAHLITCPVIFFQGMEDRIVPPNQAEEMVAALNANGVPNKYVAYEGEGHGFRQAENIIETLETELAFYRDVFGVSVD